MLNNVVQYTLDSIEECGQHNIVLTFLHYLLVFSLVLYIFIKTKSGIFQCLL